MIHLSSLPKTQNAEVPLRCLGVCKSFDGTPVLKGVDLTLQPGEMLGLIGLNGVGKTTLIKIILNLIQADAGDVNIFGVSSREDKARMAVSFLPEKFQPSRFLKGREYLALALAHFHMTYNHKKACTLADALDLDPKALDRKVLSYSKGMGQKLGLMGALLVDRPLLMLDEPMSGLDPSARIRLKNELQRVKREGRTIFFSSHILADIDEICDRIAVLHGAEFRFIGAPDTFRSLKGAGNLEAAFLNEITRAA